MKLNLPNLIIPLMLGLILQGLVTLPYLYAARAAGEDYVFSGFLLNPQDGNSYLAKMMEGWRGEWRFTLPFTAQPGEGAYLFLFYIGLGHLARALNLPLVLTYHLARLVGAILMVMALGRFYSITLPPGKIPLLALALSLFGAGLGWLALPFGVFTADFWVAEAFPFLSAYATPHFSLGLALFLWLLIAGQLGLTKRPGGTARFGWMSWVFLVGLGLAVVMPFGVVLVLVVVGGMIAQEWIAGFIRMRSLQPKVSDWFTIGKNLLWPFSAWMEVFLLILVGGGVLLLYQYWATLADAQLAVWNQQNQTPSPPVWDVLVSFSPLLLACIGLWKWRRTAGAGWIEREGSDRPAGIRLLLTWAVSGLILLYVPWSLQRRFMMGLYVPLAGLAVIGLAGLAAGKPKRMTWLTGLIFLLVIPTNLLILLAARYGTQTHDASIYLTRGEALALTWIKEETPPQAVILASPEMGLFIPGYTGRRVIYGHPFETVNAEVEKNAVEGFYRGEGDRQLFLNHRPIDYIIYGKRERRLGVLPASGLQLCYTNGEVDIYQPQNGKGH